ncbi:MAG: type IV pilus modification protein PilV [Pseudomonadota bacterium]|nr:type IV pilus modification protein PilV [Pseudomonadota bacterium]
MLNPIQGPGSTCGTQAGTSMIEVLISIVIVVLGLLGLAGLQSRAQLGEAESFQRAQAIVLLQDMVDRINSNRKNALSYETPGVGTGVAEGNCAALNGAALDLCEWNNALLGASESAGGLKVGAMIGARGCVQVISNTMPFQFLVSVVWQGVNQTVIPGTACGAGQYGDDRTRRALTSTVLIGCLQNNTATGACITTASAIPGPAWP